MTCALPPNVRRQGCHDLTAITDPGGGAQSLPIIADRSRLSAPAEADRVTWLRLLSAAPSAFLGPSFAEAVDAVIGGVRVCHLLAGDRVVGIFPFQHPNRLMRLLSVAMPVGQWVSDANGLVAEPGLHIDADGLLRLAKLSYFGFDHLTELQLRHGLSGEQPRLGLRIEFPNGSAPYWKERRVTDAKFVRDCERRLRKLAAERGQLRFTLDAVGQADELERLIQAKRNQYARTGADSDSLEESWVQDLLRRLHRTREADCTGMLSTLYAGETWVASHFGLRQGALLHYWFPVYNPEVATFAPGRLLLMQIIENGAADGLRCIDRGEGDSAAKRDFATGEQRYYRGAWTRGLGGIAARGVQSAVWRIQALRQRMQVRNQER